MKRSSRQSEKQSVFRAPGPDGATPLHAHTHVPAMEATTETASTPPPSARHPLKERGRVEVSEDSFSKVCAKSDEVVFPPI
jgi:hypothetical protein